MCRWLAYTGSPIFLEDLVCRPCHSLIHQAQAATECKAITQGDGVGIGWYGAFEEPGLYRDILPAWSDDNLRSLTRQIASPLFFAHVRASTGTSTSRANCHPFVRGRWMFMHNGQIGGWEKVRRQVEGLLTDDAYAARRGTTDSEAIFLGLPPALMAADPVAAMRETLLRIRLITIAAGIDEPLRFTAALTDGRHLHAFRYASDDRPPTLYWRVEGGNVTVVSEPLDSNRDGWSAMVPGTALTIAPGGGITVSDFDIDAAAAAAVRRPAA